MSQSELTAMSVAELKARFQKEEKCPRTNGAFPRQELLPNSFPAIGPKNVFPKTESDPTSDASSTSSSECGSTVKKRLQRFSQSPPQHKKALVPCLSPKTNEKSSPKVISTLAKRVGDDVTSQVNNNGGEMADDRKTKPAVVSRSNAKSPIVSSPYKVPKPSSNGDRMKKRDEAGDENRVPTPDGGAEHEDVQVRTFAVAKLKPNPSHLSSLINEIQQQQQRQLVQKQGKASATKVSSSPVDRGSPPPNLPPVPPVPPPRIPNVTHSPTLQTHARTSSDSSSGPPGAPHSKWKRRPLPTMLQLGPAPSKLKRPPKVKIADTNCKETNAQTPPLPQRNSTRNIGGERAPNAPLSWSNKPIPALPVVPSTTNQRQTSTYTKDNVRDSTGAPSSPIPEFTEEEEMAGLSSPDELYDDTGPNTASSIISNNTSSARTSLTLQADELYQDASLQQLNDSEELYEDVGTAETISSEQGATIYAAKKEEDRRKKENERKLKKQQKEVERKQRDIEKQNKKFNLTGNEVAMEMGVVREATKGWRKDDLTVKKGESVSILRISDTPVGKWLVKNVEGKVGYVDLTNIEVDANSIRYSYVIRQQALARSAKRGPVPDKLQSWLSKLTPCVRQVMTMAKPTQVSSDADDSSDIYEDGNSEAIYEEFA